MSDSVDWERLLSILIPVIVALVSAFFLWLGTRGKTAADQEAQREQTATEAWQKLAEHTAEKVDALTVRIETLEAANRDLLNKADAYRRHIYDWRSEYPDEGRWPTVPSIIHRDLG